MLKLQVVNTYPLSSYTFDSKEPKIEKDTSVADRLAHMRLNYMKEGMRTSMEGILLVYLFGSRLKLSSCCNFQRYGPVISTIPQQLSRFQFNRIQP